MSAVDLEPGLVAAPMPPVASDSSVLASPARDAGAGAVPSAAELGLNRLSLRLIALQVVVLAVSVPLYPLLGLSISWPTVPPFAICLTAIGAAWLYHAWMPGRPNEWIVAEAISVTFLLVSLTVVVAPAQYAAIALKRPLIDPWLAAADAVMGVHVPTLAAWTLKHRVFSWILTLAYVTLPLQLILPVFVLGMMKRNREALWEYCFHFHFCLIVTLVSLALFPAVCAFNYYGFTPTLDEARFTAQFIGLREGTFTVIRFNDLEGLISMPSFHTAAGLMVTWCFRQHRNWTAMLAILNVLMIAATFMSGAHYFVDVLATLILFLVSVLIYRRWGESFVSPSAERP
jgi:hypothetical protein